MSDLKQLLAEKERFEREQVKLSKQIEKLQEKAKSELREKIIRMCDDAGTSVEELFGQKQKRSSRGRPSVPKYVYAGRGVDGRSARTMDAFDKVVSDGAIDDKKAISAHMINPKWLQSEKSAAQQFIRDHKLDLEKYLEE